MDFLLRLLTPVMMATLAVILSAMATPSLFKEGWFWLAFGAYMVITALYHWFLSHWSRNGALLRAKGDVVRVLEGFFLRVQDEILRQGGGEVRIAIWKQRNEGSFKIAKKSQGHLFIDYFYNLDSDTAQFWRLPIGCGLVGSAWKNNKLARKRISTMKKEDFEKWGLNSIQISLLRGVDSVLALPVCWIPNRVGRLIKIESNDPKTWSVIRRARFAAWLKQETERISPLLFKQNH